MIQRSPRNRLWPGRSALLAVLVLLATACTVPTSGQAVKAPDGGPAVAPAVVRPVVTVTVVKKVTAEPKFRYQVAPAASKGPAKTRTGLPWWSTAVNTNHTSSLTFSDAHDDSASVFVQPTSPVQAKNATNQADSSAGNIWPGAGLTARTNGQVIGVFGDEAYTCSGTVVHSAHQNMVLTAGHCVWNIPVGKPHSKGGPAMTMYDQIWFVPGASQLSRPLTLDPDGLPELQAPLGIWTVESASTNDRWLQNTWITQSGQGLAQTELMHGAGSYDDIAFVTVRPLNGQDIESVTGAQGLMFSDTSIEKPQITYPTVILGYPSAAPFDGSTERYCTQTEPDTYDGDQRVQTASATCLMTPGSSGGAWFTGFDNTGGVGYVYGVTSRGGASHLTVGMLSLADDYPIYQKLIAP